MESHRLGVDGEAADESTQEHVWAGRAHGGNGVGARDGVTPEMKDALTRLELANMQMKVYLDDIDRRMGRIEPHLEGLTALVGTERVERAGRASGHQGEDLGVETVAGEAMPGAPARLKRRRSEETIAAAMERSSVARDGFGARWDERPPDGMDGGEDGAREIVGGEKEREPKVAAQEVAAEPKVIWYEAARRPRQSEPDSVSQKGVIGKETTPERKEVGDEASSNLEETRGGVEAGSPEMKPPPLVPVSSAEVVATAAREPLERGEERISNRDRAQAGRGVGLAARESLFAAVPAWGRFPTDFSGTKRRQWTVGATAAAVLVGAMMVTLYGPWHMSGSRAAEVAGSPEQSGVADGTKGVRADKTTVSQGGSGGGLSGESPTEAASGGGVGNGVGSKGRTGAGALAEGQSGPQPGGGAEASKGRQSGDRGVLDAVTRKPSAAAPTEVQGDGTAGGRKGSKDDQVAPPTRTVLGTAPTGSVDGLKSQGVEAQTDAPKNRVEGTRAEDTSRVARVENLHPDNLTDRPAAGSGPAAHVETAGLATAGGPASGTGGPVPTGAPAPASGSAGVPTAAATGGGDVPRTTVGRPELKPAGTGGTVISGPAPIYPQQARQLGLEGQVVIRATVNKVGAVTGVQVVNGPVLLQQSAQDAVRRRRYKPFLLRGEPVEFQTMVTLNYRLGK